MRSTVQLFKALSDETRLRIMALLVASGELCVCDITAALQLPQSTVSRHLAYLKNSGWVTDRREGVWMIYTIIHDGELKCRLASILSDCLPAIPVVAADIRKIAAIPKGSNCS